jgi:hypothetical protein
MEMNMRKLLISAVVALTALTGTAAPSLADAVYFQLGPGGVYVGPGYRDYPRYYRDDYRRYPRYYRDDYNDYRRYPASCRTRKEKVYSERGDRWITKSTRVCYR